MKGWARAGAGAAMRRASRLVRPGLAAAAISAYPAADVQELPALRTEVDATTTTVGGRLRLTVAVEHAPGASVRWPDSLDLAPFEVLDAAVAPPVAGDGRTATEAVFTLAAFELGELEIPSFAVEVASPAGATELFTDPFGVAVVSVGLDEGQDIRGIRGPLSIPRGWLPTALWILALALAVAAGWWLARRARRRAAEKGAVSEDGPSRSAHERALEELDRLEASGLLERGRVKDYYIEVSDVLRRYLEGRYAVRALEMTSREVLERLEGAAVGPRVHRRFASFFDECDLVKFAKHRPDRDACGAIVPAARALVDATLPPPEPEPEERTAPGDGTPDGEGGASGAGRPDGEGERPRALSAASGEGR